MTHLHSWCETAEELVQKNRADQTAPATLYDVARETLHDLPRLPQADAPHVVAKSLTAIPIRPDGTPDWEQRVLGTSLEFSDQEVRLELSCPDNFLTTALLLMFQGPDGTRPCAGLEVLATQGLGEGRLRVTGRWGGFAAEILQPDKLTPTLAVNQLEFRLGFPEELLRSWADIGVLQPLLVDRVLVCPKCQGLPTFRLGCRQCGSAHVAQDTLIHHYACAHVSFTADFEGQGELVCPKCRTRRLVVGADYEFLTGPYRCADCHWSEGELEHVAECLRCRFRFPGHQAHELELRGYRADRLDVLALAQAS
ncbi:MAG: hypothetical protein L0Z62_07215 [Gemmataceae bacterium]|nr:hypothetical protein [Gemmataceae bacterium]